MPTMLGLIAVTMHYQGWKLFYYLACKRRWRLLLPNTFTVIKIRMKYAKFWIHHEMYL